MKNLATKFLLIFAISSGLIATGCSDDPVIDPIDDGSNQSIEGTDLSGSVEEDRTLDPSKTYTLTGVLSVESGATLTIPAGTRIVAKDDTAATDVYIVVQKGANIEINGTASEPVKMSAASGQSGSWGGLVIAGNAKTTEGLGATAEVGGIIYGGSDANDSSGSINYLIISDAGAQINSESQYNGLSLYSVGAGTNIQNIAILNGADDGVEFFGGSVAITNLYLENNEDDAVDWTEGWNGSITNTYVLHSIANFSTAIEADGQNNNPLIENFTAVSETGGTALQFKKQSGATINGLSLKGYNTVIDIAEVGRTNLSGIQIEGASANLEATFEVEATVEVSMFNWAK